MKKLLPVMLVLLFTVSCASSRYYKKAQSSFDRGNYVESAQFVLVSLRENPKNQDAMLLLVRVFPLAVDSLKETIQAEKAGQGDFRWSNTADAYRALHALNDAYAALPPLTHKKQNRTIWLETEYFTAEYEEASRFAAEEQYLEGIRLSRGNDKEIFRNAISRFEKAMDYSPGYKDSAQRITELGKAASDYVLLLPPTDLPRARQERQLAEAVYSELSVALFQGARSKRFMKIVDRENFEKILQEQELVLTGLVSEGAFTEIGALSNADMLVTFSVVSVDYSPRKDTARQEYREKLIPLKPDHSEYTLYDNHEKPYFGYINFYKASTSMRIQAQYRIIDVNSSQILDTNVFVGDAEEIAEWLEYDGDREILSDSEIRLAQNMSRTVASFQDLSVKARKSLVDKMSSAILRNFK